MIIFILEDTSVVICQQLTSDLKWCHIRCHLLDIVIAAYPSLIPVVLNQKAVN